MLRVMKKQALAGARLRFARAMRRYRLEKTLSQEELAELTGLHRTYIGSVERGERNVSVDNMDAISTALGLDIKDFF